MEYYIKHKYLRNTQLIVAKEISNTCIITLDENGLVLLGKEEAEVLLTNPEFTIEKECYDEPVSGNIKIETTDNEAKTIIETKENKKKIKK